MEIQRVLPNSPNKRFCFSVSLYSCRLESKLVQKEFESKSKNEKKKKKKIVVKQRDKRAVSNN